MLFVLRRLGLRTHDGRPGASEILVPLVVWSVAFEIILPSWLPFKGLAFADHLDVFFYTLGASFSAVFWRQHYFRPQRNRNVAMEMGPSLRPEESIGAPR
jgi:hypothetical protein